MSPGAGGALLTAGYSALPAETLPLADPTRIRIGEVEAPRDGILRNLIVRQPSPNAGVTFTYTVFIDDIATAIALAIPTGDYSGATGLLPVVPVLEGQRITVRVTTDGEPPTQAANVTLEILFGP